MKQLLFISILILRGVLFANDTYLTLETLRQKLSPEQQQIFNDIFDINEKLLDSYKIDLKYLKPSDFNYKKKLNFLESKIKELENDRHLEIEKLERNLKEYPEKYKK